MNCSFSRLLWVLFTLLIACKQKAIDPTKRVRPVSLRISASGTEYQLSWQGVRVDCATSPCPDTADVEAQEYEIQVASSESSAFRTYQTVDADIKSIRIPASQVGEQLVARIVSKNNGAPSVNSNLVMATIGWLAQSAYYPGFGLTEGVIGGDVTPDGKKSTYSKRIEESAGQFANILYVADLQNEQIISSKTVSRLETVAALSPDGKQLAYPSKTENGLIIYDIAAERSRTLPVPDASWIAGLKWAPDGQWLAFSTVTNEASRLYKIATSGGQAIPLTPSLPIRESNYIRQSAIGWSTDGRYIAVSRARGNGTSEEGRAAVSLFSADGSGETSYFETQPGWVDSNPSYAPDGKQLAFLSTRTDPAATSCSLWIRDLTTRKIRQIILLPGLNPTDDFAPRWLGNERLLFKATQEGRKGYFTVFL